MKPLNQLIDYFVKKSRDNNPKAKEFFLQSIPLWISSIFIGLISTSYAALLHFGEETFLYFYQQDRAWVFALAPIFFLLSYLTVFKFGKHANGSGIPQVMAVLNMNKRYFKAYSDQFLSLRIIVVKIVSSFFMSLGGGVVGREGPTIQIAASVLHFTNKILPSSWPKINEKLMIITGASAGLAAAFNTPLGGIVFAIEELTKNHLKYLRTTIFAAVIIAGFTAQTILGPYLIFGYPKVDAEGIKIFLLILLTSVLCGIIGTYFGQLVFFVNDFRRKLKRIVQFIFGFLMVMIFCIIVYYTNADSVGAGNFLLDRLLFETDKTVEWYTIPARLINGVISFGNGGAGGVFAPALSFGGTIGSFIGEIFSLKPRQMNMLILIGMVGFLTSFTRSPFTSAILVLEMTDRHSVIFYFMVAALVSYLIANTIDKRSFYERTSKAISDALPNLEEDKSKKSSDIRV
ncbi:chloride channel protein [Vaginella massiliensis]|uniref:chloride channel protein n=1 Tax=Vaginella massiliensis TaxID=1816680 RepID=UPI000B003B5F|nr:chloride channel protein [Vaginella massiliensis]